MPNNRNCSLVKLAMNKVNFLMKSEVIYEEVLTSFSLLWTYVHFSKIVVFNLKVLLYAKFH